METRSALCLRDLPIFASAGVAVFRPVCEAADKKTLRRGESLFVQGEQVAAVHLIKQGSFKLVRVTEDGREIVLRLAGPGEVLGEDALFHDGAHAASAVAVEEARVCSISRSRLEEVIRQRPDLAWQVIASLGSRLYELWSQLGEMTGQTTREKVLNLLVRLASDHGEREDAGTRIRLRLTQQDIAGMVGSSRVMVANVLKDLYVQGYLVKQGRWLVVKDKCSLVGS